MLSNFQVLMELEGSDFPGEAQPDGNDIRLTDAEDHTLLLPITVQAKAEAGGCAEWTADTSESEEKELAWHYCGGKPICLVELMNVEKKEAKVRELLGIRMGQIEGLIEDANEFGYKISYGKEEIVLNKEDILKSLNKFANKDHIKVNELSKPVKLGLIKANILFFDPVKQILKSQSKLELLAIREVINSA